MDARRSGGCILGYVGRNSHSYCGRDRRRRFRHRGHRRAHRQRQDRPVDGAGLRPRIDNADRPHADCRPIPPLPGPTLRRLTGTEPRSPTVPSLDHALPFPTIMSWNRRCGPTRRRCRGRPDPGGAPDGAAHRGAGAGVRWCGRRAVGARRLEVDSLFTAGLRSVVNHVFVATLAGPGQRGRGGHRPRTGGHPVSPPPSTR